MKTALKKVLCMAAVAFGVQQSPLMAQKAGDFRSAATGNFSNSAATSSTSVWQQLAVTGASWKIIAASGTTATPAQISTVGFSTTSWKNAVVPGTAFYSYVANGTEANPDIADNVYNVNKATYDANYWYRTEFTASGFPSGSHIWLNFVGINKRAEVYLNGHHILTIKGLMQRAKYDVTSIVSTTGSNALAVMIVPPRYDPTNGHPLANWESPTYVDSQGWDWMPEVPGLNSGITEDVYLSSTGGVAIEDPWVRTSMPNTSTANLTVSTSLHNVTGSSVSGTLKVTINPGPVTFTTGTITIPANTTQTVSYNSSNYAALSISNPKLWWPNGYGGNADGTQQLYTCYVEFDQGGTALSDSITKSFGIRKLNYDTTALNGSWRLLVNNVPIFIKGGNWGMSDYLLRCRGTEYNTKVRFHKEMNFNMIRNWTGETTDEDFYNYCDKYGIMVFDEFWLNNFGGVDSVTMLQNNAIEKVKKFRNHPSITIWCGANEGIPGGDTTSSMNVAFKNAISTYDGNDRIYMARSNAGVKNQPTTGGSHNLSGSGPWDNKDSRTYFTNPQNGYPWSNGWYGLRSEIGTASFVNVESFKKFMPSAYWIVPPASGSTTDMWARHFWSTNGGYGGGSNPSQYTSTIISSYGTASSIDDYCKKAQLLNIETTKAMFEGWNDHMWNNASGILMWMSQSSYPTMIWQTYDFYYDLTGAYFGCKKACEAEHLQWNSYNNSVKLINNRTYALLGMVGETIVYNKNGTVAPGYYQRVTANVNPTSATHLVPIFSSVASYNKPVTASSTAAGFGTSAINDGCLTSRWSSNNNDNEWVQIDLGSTSNTVTGVRLNWETAYGSKYIIQTSANGSTWTNSYTNNSGVGGIETLTFPTPATGVRYVRMQGVTRATTWGYSLWEFDVFTNTSNNVSYGSTVTASSSNVDDPSTVVDGNPSGQRWSSNYNDNEWIQLDLGSTMTVNAVRLTWETAYGTKYIIQTSSNGTTWNNSYTNNSGVGGVETLTFSAPATGVRYVRMQGVARATQWGYSLYEFEAFTSAPPALSDVHFLKLKLSDVNGFVSDNLYWRGNTYLNYTGLNSMSATTVSVSTPSISTLSNGNKLYSYTITNPTSSAAAAFGVRCKFMDGSGNLILPVIKNDDYFTLMKGESKTFTVEVNPALITGSVSMTATPYNH